MTSINLYIRKGDDYVWRAAKALAKEQNTSLAELVVHAVIEYIKNHPILTEE